MTTGQPDPMQPWPALAQYGRKLNLPQADVEVYLDDSQNPGLPPLLLLHGLGDDADTWRHVFAPLAEHYRVVALDLPGFGRSDKPRRIYALGFLRDCVVEAMDILALQRATLMGNSLGAMLAELIALQHPDRVAQLILLGGSLTTRLRDYHQSLLLLSLPFLGRRLYDSLRGKPEAAYASMRLFYADLDKLPETDRQFLLQRAIERVADTRQRDAFFSVLHQLTWQVPLARPYHAARLARLNLPTVAIWGGQDQINALKTAQNLIARQSQARLAVLPEAGHLPQQETPEGLMQAVLGR